MIVKIKFVRIITILAITTEHENMDFTLNSEYDNKAHSTISIKSNKAAKKYENIEFLLLVN